MSRIHFLYMCTRIAFESFAHVYTNRVLSFCTPIQVSRFGVFADVYTNRDWTFPAHIHKSHLDLLHMYTRIFLYLLHMYTDVAFRPFAHLCKCRVCLFTDVYTNREWIFPTRIHEWHLNLLQTYTRIAFRPSADVYTNRDLTFGTRIHELRLYFLHAYTRIAFRPFILVYTNRA